MTLPLAGVKVLDITANMSGPFATMVLGDEGADVIKVEPPAGDPIRGIGPAIDGMSAFYANLNRSKRTVMLDLRSPDAQPTLDTLLDWADVVVHNYRPDAARSLRIDVESARANRPGLVHVTITGFGSSGPLAGRPVYDHVIQAMSGFADRQRDRGVGDPQMVRHGIIDKLVGWATAQAVCAALVGRATTGEGRAIEVCMLDVAIATLWPDGMMDHTILDPHEPRPDVANGLRPWPTNDGHVAFITLTAEQSERLAVAFDLDDDEIASAARVRMTGIMRLAARRMADLPTDEVVDRLVRNDVPVAPVVARSELHAVPQVVANGTVDEFVHPVLGPIRQSAPAVRFDGERPSTLRPAAQLGADNAEIFGMLEG